ncbi:polar amino acid transport system substrate-binding protein [Actinoalloteichus hoggarensis]|uniref:ABC transporter glutamine-binding protein GlnH n=1 Tax=Actinoalloteichus hoggarensis TaxID=1470176 RepID=A0A221W2L0_9PSEU|nr:glutamate ABC transporter substrate-binding protein [Actinoalloteichus hoggarensis]ASO19841.1 ABC transporter glutamine-binding protein GlnH precursor [Actinoalloteichus hoggarensis]MBB5919452.1 polar amino acid transport system substrate-binding protein [Actinoalloteichus hoggarensis]
MRSGSRLAALLTAVLVLAGCAGGPGVPADVDVDVERPTPVGAEVTSGLEPPPADNPSCDPTASLRPSGGLPTPGQMPAGSTMEEIVDRGFLIAGVDQTTYLMGYRDPTAEGLSGFDIDLVNELAEALFGEPGKVRYVTVTSEQREQVLADGTVDVVVRTMTVTCDRWENVSFSTVYFEAGQRLLVHRDSEYEDVADLAGERVCSARGSTSLRRIDAHDAGLVAVAVADWADCLVMLQQGQVEGFSTDDTILAGMARQDPQLHVVGDRFSSEPYGMAFNKDDEDFVRFANALLARMRQDGTWERMYNTWLTDLGPAPAPPAANYQD